MLPPSLKRRKDENIKIDYITKIGESRYGGHYHSNHLLPYSNFEGLILSLYDPIIRCYGIIRRSNIQAYIYF